MGLWAYHSPYSLPSSASWATAGHLHKGDREVCVGEDFKGTSWVPGPPLGTTGHLPRWASESDAWEDFKKDSRP